MTIADDDSVARPARRHLLVGRIPPHAQVLDLDFALALRAAAQRLRCAAAMRCRASALTGRRLDGTPIGRPRLPRW